MLAPSCLGSISVIQVNTVNPASNDTPYTAEWKVGRDSFLAATHAVESDYQTQNLTQAMFSGEGLFVYVFRGWGPLFVQGLGAIVERKVCYHALSGHIQHQFMQTDMLTMHSSKLMKHLQSTMVSW